MVEAEHSSTVRYELRQELLCLLCARPICDPATGKPIMVNPLAFVQLVAALRCDVCGGRAIGGEIETVRRYTERYDWLSEQPRKGRPRKDRGMAFTFEVRP